VCLASVHCGIHEHEGRLVTQALFMCYAAPTAAETEALYATLAAKCDHPTLAELTLRTSSAAHMAMPPTLLAAPRWSPSLR
jgi:hypothetical protein